MDDRTNGIRSMRRRAASAAVCSVIAAVVGGTLIATPAYADGATTPVFCGTTQLVGDAAAGVLNGAAGGLTIGLPNCTVPAAPTTPSSTSTTTPTAVPSTAPVTTTAGDGATAGTATVDPATAPATTTALSGGTSDGATLSHVAVVSSTDSVYPVKDGYLDFVKFAVTAVNADGQLVPVHGTAILSKAKKVVRSWTLDGSKSVISWDGRNAGKVRTGVYTLVVTAWSPDGSVKTTENKVRVLSKHVERRAVMVDSTVRAGAASASMPSAVLKAYAKGLVTVRLRTVAKVHGPAKVVFANDGVTRTVVLRNGTHTTGSLVVPKGFERVTITHKWARGAAELKSVRAIWTYYTLVK